MPWRETIKMAVRALRAHAFRSILTIASITLGAFSIVLMTSLADSGFATLARDFDDLGGARLLLVTPNEPQRMKGKASLSSGLLDTDDRDALLAALPYLEAATFYATSGEGREATNDRGTSIMTDLVAADPGFFDVFGMTIAAGRAFTVDEDRTAKKLCVVGPMVARALYDGNAVGKRLTIGGLRCLIVGQTASRKRNGMRFGFDWESFVVAPLEAVREVDPVTAMGAILQTKTVAVAHNDIVKRIANAIMTQRHNGVDDFQIWDFAGIRDRFAQMFTILKVIVGFIASIALVVGGVGVMNMMFVSVSERTREIGIRKALGASPNAIRSQFLVESALLSGVGGALGVAGGIGAAIVISMGIQKLEPIWVGTVSLPAVVIATTVCIGIGLLFGVGPARRAAQLDVVDAIRRS